MAGGHASLSKANEDLRQLTASLRTNLCFARSDGLLPHLINIQFARRTVLTVGVAGRTGRVRGN